MEKPYLFLEVTNDKKERERIFYELRKTCAVFENENELRKVVGDSEVNLIYFERNKVGIKLSELLEKCGAKYGK